MRLNYKSASMRRPSREQEVLHYQWFADLGSVEAQRAVGQIFSHGAMRNPEQALRYFRCTSVSPVLPLSPPVSVHVDRKERFLSDSIRC